MHWWHSYTVALELVPIGHGADSVAMQPTPKQDFSRVASRSSADRSPIELVYPLGGGLGRRFKSRFLLMIPRRPAAREIRRCTLGEDGAHGDGVGNERESWTAAKQRLIVYS